MAYSNYLTLEQQKLEVLQSNSFAGYSPRGRIDLHKVLNDPLMRKGYNLAPLNLVRTFQTDTFSVTGTGGGTPPVICGTNSGYHSESTSRNPSKFRSAKS